MPLDRDSGIYYEVFGDAGPSLLLGFPIFASMGDILGAAATATQKGFLAGLTDRYRVLLLDYPSIGQSRDTDPTQLTVDRVCADLLAVADAAGFRRFAYWGYSWGACVGYQLALRTNRLTALVMGGWPPLGGQYEDMLKASEEQVDDPPPEVQVVLRSPAQYAQWVAFYASLQTFDDAPAAREVSIPRLAYAGANGDTTAGSFPIRNASILEHKKAELENLGWQVALIADATHEDGLNPAKILPAVQPFLEQHVQH
ncbi:MAG: alpha/beta hydrolase [Pseudomonadota bacterium]